MKQTILTIAFAIIFSGLFAAPKHNVTVKDYVVTDEGIIYAEKVRTGFNHCLVAVSETGEKIKIDLDDVNAYRKDGKEYKRLYVVNEGSIYVKSILLQRLITRAGYTLYKRVSSSNEQLSLNDFYIYEGDQLVHQLNKVNYKVALSFFYSKFNMMFADKK